MSGASASPAVELQARPSSSALLDAARVGAVPATIVLIVAAALLVLFTPLYMHRALDLAGAPATTGLPAGVVHEYSDRTVGELFLGPATFAFTAPDGRPFYDRDEIGHLQDVRFVLLGFLGIAGVAAVILAASLWRWRSDRGLLRVIGGAGAATAIVTAGLGVFVALAFSLAFELFHRLLFPGGNWSFDPASQRLVQLYPLAFWQLTAAAMGSLIIGGGLAVWWLARRRAARLGGRRA